MLSLKVTLGILAAGLMLSGCMQTTYEATNTTTFKPRDKDTLFRIHGTNQPEYIGASISSGCIRMTNEDVIDLYNHAKVGTIVVVLEPKHGDSPFNSQMALQGGSNPIQ